MRPFSSVLSGTYVSSAKIKSKTLPWPPVILAMISLPQIIKAITNAIRTTRTPMETRVMILRFLLGGFLAFLTFLKGFLEALSSPVCSSKSKAWTGLRKSSVILTCSRAACSGVRG